MQSAWMFSVNERDFKAKVLERSKDVPVIVDFWAPWCGPCRQLTPLLERLIEERQGDVLLAKVNIDEEQGLAQQFRIDSVPTVIAFRAGRAVLDFVGLLPESDIRRFLVDIGPTEAEREASRALALEKTDPAQAEKIYRDALAKDRNQESAILGLVRLLLDKGNHVEAGALLENLAPSSAHAEEAERLSARLWLLRAAGASAGNEEKLRASIQSDPRNAQARYELGCLLAVCCLYSEALEMLLSAGELSPVLASTKVREAMVQIFHLVGNDTALANDYRNRLSLLLY